jgi:hypothetical protein
LYFVPFYRDKKVGVFVPFFRCAAGVNNVHVQNSMQMMEVLIQMKQTI